MFQYSGGIGLVEQELQIHCWGKHFNEKRKRHEQGGGTADVPCWRALNSSRKPQDLDPQRNEGRGKERKGREGRSMRGDGGGERRGEEVNRTRKRRLNNKIDTLLHSVSLASLECQYAVGQLCSHLQPT